MISNLPQREEFLRKKRKRKIIKYSVVTFLLLLILGIISYISHRREIRISKVELSGGVLVTEEDVQLKSLSFLSGSYFWLFPKNNIFLYSREGLQDYLRESFKRIDTIEIKRKDFETIIVTITERKPFAIWCSETPVIENVENCYFMDQNSTVFAPAPNFSGDAYFKYYGLLNDIEPVGKEYMSSTTQFLEISNFVSTIKKIGIKPLHIKAKNGNEFSLVLSGGGEIYFDTTESLVKVVQNLTALLQTKELSISPSGILPVEYIDLRYGNKLFYKLKSN